MTDRPILFSAPMVRALLDGRKTQTRRVLKPQPTMHEAGDCSIGGHRGPVDYLMREVYPQHMVRFRKGDRLWVRETFCYGPADENPLYYRATDTVQAIEDGDGFAILNKDGSEKSPWRPSIHMPRWASRLTLTVTDVRVQRLQECSEADALAEGVVLGVDHPNKHFGELSRVTAREMYAALWDVINGSGSWLANPWIVAVTFSVERRNIDP